MGRLPVEREIVLSTAAKLGKLVVLAGDTHNAWCSRPDAGQRHRGGPGIWHQQREFTGFEEYLAALPRSDKQIFEGVVNDLRYADTSRRGFLLMNFTPTEAKGTFLLREHGEVTPTRWMLPPR